MYAKEWLYWRLWVSWWSTKWKDCSRAHWQVDNNNDIFGDNDNDINHHDHNFHATIMILIITITTITIIPVIILMIRLNKCGVISPRYDITSDEIETWIGRLLPSRQVHIYIYIYIYSDNDNAKSNANNCDSDNNTNILNLFPHYYYYYRSNHNHNYHYHHPYLSSLSIRPLVRQVHLNHKCRHNGSWRSKKEKDRRKSIRILLLKLLLAIPNKNDSVNDSDFNG